MRFKKQMFRSLVLLIIVLASSSIPLYAQERDRLITTVKSMMRPTIGDPGVLSQPTDSVFVEVIGFTLAGVPVAPDQPFAAGDDWLKDLTVRVKNISSKPISFIRMIFAIPEAKFVTDGREGSMGYALEYREGSRVGEGAEEMKTVLPGEEVELVYMGGPFVLFQQQIAKKTGVMSISRLRTGGDISVTFKDMSTWHGSNLKIPSQAVQNY